MTIGGKEIYLYKFENLHAIEDFINSGLKMLQKVNQNQEIFINNEENSIMDSLNKRYNLPIKDEELLQEYNEILRSEMDVFIEIRRHIRYSMFLSSYSFFESSLRFLCNEVSENTAFKLSKKAANISSIEHYWNFLIIKFQIKTKNSQKDFDSIKNRKDLRDAITHKNGVVKPTKVVNISGVNIESNYFGTHQIEIKSSEFVAENLKEYWSFFSEVLLEIDKRYYELYIK